MSPPRGLTLTHIRKYIDDFDEALNDHSTFLHGGRLYEEWLLSNFAKIKTSFGDCRIFHTRYVDKIAWAQLKWVREANRESADNVVSCCS